MIKTEDKVRDEARILLNFVPDNNSQCDVGQLTTFNQLGFKGFSDKPDGWYLPKNTSEVAIILETKNSEIDINKDACRNELFKNIDIASIKYKKVIGILYNGNDVLVYKDKQLIDLKKQLFTKEYYLSLYNQNTIDKNKIFSLTEKVNNNLHKNFGINNLYHRMIFTACALVAQRYNTNCLRKGDSWDTLHTSILSTIKKSYEKARQQNLKLDLIAHQFAHIQCNYTENQEAIDEFIECINEISISINSDYWNGEDVMAIFFNEFTRYKGKSEQGQVFTPDHITSLIYRVTGTNYKDNVLDACCGSGSFLVKAMSYMINEVGGINNITEVKKIKEDRLFGVEFSKELYALACANMLIHKDGKTNLIQDDSRTKDVSSWIKDKKISKVLMNPPYENIYGCLDIVKNVLDSVEDGAICAFIMPDSKLEKKKKKVMLWLKSHSLLKIIKLPDVFAGMAGVSTSIFIFKAHEPQGNKQIFGCWIKDDGLETVKNKGRLDVKNRWKDIENKWVEIIYKQSGDETIQWINPNDKLLYTKPESKVEFYERDFEKNVLAYILFDKQNAFKEYSEIFKLIGKINVLNKKLVDVSNWIYFDIGDVNGLFSVQLSKGDNKIKELKPGNIPLVSALSENNGIVGYIENGDGKAEKFKAKSITVDMFGNTFYQNNEYYAVSHGRVNMLIPNTKINKFHGLFIVTMLKELKNKYSFDGMCTSKKMEKEKILLPSIKNEQGVVEPDWGFMQGFVKDIFSKIQEANLINEDDLKE